MSIFEKKYEIVKGGPEAVDWDVYESETLKAYRELLTRQTDDEAIFQEFFEKNPSMMPGAFGFFGEGFTPCYNILISKPRLSGLKTRIPDFMWIARDSCTIYPIFVEIEIPSKRWFTIKGQPTAEFTQAQTQLTEWKAWFHNSIHQQLFFEFYEVDSEFRKGKTINPHYVLIYGSRYEFRDRPDLSEKRNHLKRDSEIYMTFDRLTPNPRARNVITCKKTDKGYIGKYVSPTFQLGPLFAKENSKVKEKEKAIRNSAITKERKEFLISRLGYWDDFGRKDHVGICSSTDWE